MNLLPKTDVDFAQADYWNKFFTERGSKEFEWYGEYNELNDLLQKYLKNLDAILMAGCGNSSLSSDLFDSGYRHITNIDISPVVIEQMRNKVGSKRPGMIFKQMDALNMTFNNESFTVVLDKGTLDALMPANKEADIQRVKRFFSEIDRVLKMNGRYIIISLLQEHVLQAVLDHFTHLGWMVRILRCWNVEKRNIVKNGRLTMPVFMIVCVKFKNLKVSQPVIEVNLFIDGKTERIASKEEVVTIVKGIQGTIQHCRQAEGEIEIKFCNNTEDAPRYTIFIVDISQDQRKLLTYGAFIVPHGRETEWMFSTTEGRNYLRRSSGFDRLAVITFHRHQKYGSLQDVQNELRQSILQLAPPFMSITSESPNIPYLTLGDGVGHREIIYSGTSEFSGDLLVEDVDIESDTFRRLIFMNNQAVVQSEVKLKRKAGREGEKNSDDAIDKTHIASQHILYMSIAAVMKSSSEGSGLRVAVVGVGGGGLCLLLHDLLPKASITGVDIDPMVVELAQKYFGLKLDNRLNVIVQDGLSFLKQKLKFDVIMLDVDSKERGSPMSCPPPQFMESDILAAAADSLGHEGVFVTNVVSRVNSEHIKLIKKLKKHFGLIGWYNLKEDVNRIVFASNSKGKSKSAWQHEIGKGASLLDRKLREKLTETKATVDLDHLLQNLTI